MSNAQVSSLSVGMIFKHFVYEYGHQFNTADKGIDADGSFAEREEFNYFLHSATCNVNCPITTDEGMVLDQCTCGYNKEEQRDPD